MWIEIVYGNGGTVSTVKSCHVCGMWIEIRIRQTPFPQRTSHATYVACGLKYRKYAGDDGQFRHATYVACGLKSFFACAGDTAGDVMPRMWHVD